MFNHSFIFLKGGLNRKISVQKWLPYDSVLENGIIIRKNKLIKIIKVLPINYELKSELEKKSILEAYKLFLRTCDFDIQILIQSKKENISKEFFCIKEDENESINILKNQYFEFIENLNSYNKSSSKNFFILLSFVDENIPNENIERQINEKVLKTKDTLSKCGNTILEINDREEVIEILSSFFNPKYKFVKGG